VTLLLATDLLSEGMNLQDASVVVHLDLPWNPARLAQRVGRVRRAGGSSLVRSYLIAPPAESELLLQVEERLRRKLASAEATVGRSVAVIPTLTESRLASELGPSYSGTHSAADRARTLERIARWSDPSASVADGDSPVIAGVESPRRGWLAAFSDGQLVASLDGAPADSSASVAAAVVLADGGPRTISNAEREEILATVDCWKLASIAAKDAGVGAVSGWVQRLILARTAELLAESPRHTRGSLVPLVTALRQSSTRPATLGMERELTALLERSPSRADARSFLQAALDILRWDGRSQDGSPRRELVAVVTFGALHDGRARYATLICVEH
jgi:Superfamily II DNA and RNA helicases